MNEHPIYLTSRSEFNEGESKKLRIEPGSLGPKPNALLIKLLLLPKATTSFPAWYHWSRYLPNLACIYRLPNDESPSHGFLVVKYMMARGALQDFEKQWRVRFIETLKPKFLHELWSVDYNHLKMSA